MKTKQDLINAIQPKLIEILGDCSKKKTEDICLAVVAGITELLNEANSAVKVPRLGIFKNSLRQVNTTFSKSPTQDSLEINVISFKASKHLKESVKK